MKRVSQASEMYTQKHDENEKEHEFLLDQSSEISNAFTNEKMKIEEHIKKGKEQYEEILQRAMAAEVSVLENGREMETYKLRIMESQAEGYLKNLKQLSSDSAAYPDLQSDVQSWESFLSDVRKEIEKVESQFGEQIKAIKNGSRLSELPKVQTSELSFPAWNTIRPKSLPESSGREDRGPSTSASHETGTGTVVPKDSSLVSASGHPVGAPSPLPASAPHQLGATWLPQWQGAGQAAPPEQSPAASERPPVPPGRAARPSPSPKKPFNSIIEHLSVVFPCCSSTELAGFIKKVRNKSKNSLSGLSIDEIVQRVTKHILDEQKSQKPSPGQDRRSSESSSDASVMGAAQGPPSMIAGPSPKTQGQRTEDIPTWGAHSCEICHEVFKSKNMRVLKCGHKFHKGCFRQCQKGQSTCPACLDHVLLSEE
nr:tetratricopeptide repeat domain 3 [Molossus molossus]